MEPVNIAEQVSDLESKPKRISFIPARIVASVLVSVFLIFYCYTIIDDAYYFYYPPFPLDYLGPTQDYPAVTIWSTVIACAGILLISLLLIWKVFKLKWRLVAVGSIVILIIGFSLILAFQRMALNNILEIHAEGISGEEVNLIFYEPFREDTRAKTLDEPSTLCLKDNLPRLDGATALYPLYASFARATYPEAHYSAYDLNSGIACSRTSVAFENLLDGEVDLIFLMGVSEAQRQQAEELGLELKLVPIGREAFVFFVNRQNSMTNLSVENVRDIYSGNITNWSDVGGENREILAYQRPETSGSQTMLKEIMGDMPIVEVPIENYYDEMMGMYRAVAYKNHKNALGYSFLYYIKDMIAEDKIKFLSIDGIEPTAANVASGAYPFAHDFYAITVVRQPATNAEAARAENTEKLLEWILGPQGQSLVEETGYVPLP